MLGKAIWTVLIIMNIFCVTQVFLFGIAFLGPLLSALLGTGLIAYLDLRLKIQQLEKSKHE